MAPFGRFVVRGPVHAGQQRVQLRLQLVHAADQCGVVAVLEGVLGRAGEGQFQVLGQLVADIVGAEEGPVEAVEGAHHDVGQGQVH